MKHVTKLTQQRARERSQHPKKDYRTADIIVEEQKKGKIRVYPYIFEQFEKRFLGACKVLLYGSLQFQMVPSFLFLLHCLRRINNELLFPPSLPLPISAPFASFFMKPILRRLATFIDAKNVRACVMKSSSEYIYTFFWPRKVICVPSLVLTQ